MSTQTTKEQFEELVNTGLYEGRKVVLVAKVGSVNYNLNDKSSDEDFKVYVLPTKQDLYNGTRFVSSKTGDVDFAVHDVRDLEKHLFKANVNFVEVLFSVQTDTYAPEVDDLLLLREDVARMNLSYLFDAQFGLLHNKLKVLEKGTKGTAHLVEEYGYCTKAFMTGYRGLDFLLRYHKSGFTSFKEAFRYTDEEREQLLAMKRGSHTLEEAQSLLEEMKERVEAVKADFKANELDEKTKEKVHQLLFSLVYRELE